MSHAGVCLAIHGALEAPALLRAADDVRLGGEGRDLCAEARLYPGVGRTGSAHHARQGLHRWCTARAWSTLAESRNSTSSCSLSKSVLRRLGFLTRCSLPLLAARFLLLEGGMARALSRCRPRRLRGGKSLRWDGAARMSVGSRAASVARSRRWHESELSRISRSGTVDSRIRTF